MGKLVPAEPGWHVVTVTHQSDRTLAIRNVHKITHWDKFNYPVQNGKPLLFDPDDVRHVSYVAYLMDPLGRLLGREREVIANSVFDLNEAYKRSQRGFD